jgi:hypothetical protein
VAIRAAPHEWGARKDADQCIHVCNKLVEFVICAIGVGLSLEVSLLKGVRFLNVGSMTIAPYVDLPQRAAL